MASHSPPKGIPSERLFAMLAVAPVPTYRLTADIGVDGVLVVHALRPADLATARAYAEHPHADVMHSRMASAVVAAALHSDGARVFASGDEVADLPAPMADRIIHATLNALDIVSPARGAVDAMAWHIALCEGAKHWSNVNATRALGTAYRVHYGLKAVRITNEPERFFGVPLAELTDGQWMAVAAARAVIEESYQ